MTENELKKKIEEWGVEGPYKVVCKSYDEDTKRYSTFVEYYSVINIAELVNDEYVCGVAGISQVKISTNLVITIGQDKIIVMKEGTN